MSNKAFQQNLDDKKGPQPGGPYLIQMLFKEPVEMPDKEKMTAVMEKHIGSTECFCYDKKMAGFAAQEHIAEFKDGKCPVQLMVMKCDKFKGKGFDAFLMSQMWDCQEDRERIFRECKYQVVATDMLAATLPALERANLDADFLEALAELYPTCEAFYFQNCGKLFLAEDVRSHQIEGPDRFIRFGVNVRFFNIEGTEDMLIDTVGMSTLFLPDLQYHFHGMDPNWVVNHAYNVASYILEHDNPIQDGETIDVMMPKRNGFEVCREIRETSKVPIIMLTAKGEESDELNGFELGVDEYISKPFSPKILVARVGAILRRSGKTQDEEAAVSMGGIVLDKAAHMVTVDGERIDLSYKEFELLAYFMENAGIALSREKILNSVWNYDYFGDARTIDTHVKKLRAKMGDKGKYITTVWGMGYKFEVTEE